MVAKLTQKEAVAYVKSQEGKGYDYDNYAGWQCFDSVNYYWHQLFGHGLKGEGAADIPNQNDFTNEAKVYQNTPSFLPKPGDVVVWNRKYGGGYGHVAVVISATLNSFVVIEQNWFGGGKSKTEVATKRTKSYDNPMWFIRPYYKSENAKKVSTQSATKTTVKKKPKAKKKMKKLTYIRDEVKGYRLPNRGYKPKGVVLHDDAGSAGATAETYHKGLVNAPYSRLAAGIAHSYISGNTVYQALPENRVGWHTANQYGNKNYYGIERCQSIGSSDKVFLENEQTSFQEAARLLNKWGLKANRNTVRLHNEFTNTECPNRAARLHLGMDTKRDEWTEAAQLKLKDYFIKQIRAYQAGKVPTTTVSSKSSSASNTKSTVAGAWKRNSYGTWYMSEKARFTNGSQPIMVRTTGPFRSCPYAYDFQPGGYTPTYKEVMLQDGHVWISYDWQGKTYYLPIRTWNGVAPPNHGVGPLWGTIS
ncbi:SH3 domain-containing protein [Staphylococcus ureilyticus]|uniref:SH3 domain-containing protein n=1 Tax=Staphylococcus ureilyticus TaxID=94138 RepID=UPI00387AF528